jgi:hypothetical protein
MHTHTSILEREAGTGGPPPMLSPKFPQEITINHRAFYLRSEIDDYKAQLLAAAQGVAPIYPPHAVPDNLVPRKQFAAEMGIGTRTICRRVVEARTRTSTLEDQAA